MKWARVQNPNNLKIIHIKEWHNPNVTLFLFKNILNMIKGSYSKKTS